MNSSRAPWFTIFVPTCDRAATLRGTLETCVRQTYDQLRILVSNNASADSTQELVDDFVRRDARVRCIRPASRLGMSDHWEWALEQIEPGYVIIIGDDDAVIPGAIERIVAAATEHGMPDAITWPISYYHYPEIPDPGLSGNLRLNLSGTTEWRDSAVSLDRVRRFESPYFELPTPYHNCVHTDLFSKLREKGLPMIRSRFPDIYLSAALTTLTSRFLRLADSATVNAISGYSTGYSKTVARASKEQGARFDAESRLPLHSSLRYFESLHVATAEALLQARDALASDDLTPDWRLLVTRLQAEFDLYAVLKVSCAFSQSDIDDLAASHDLKGGSGGDGTDSGPDPRWWPATWDINLDVRPAGVHDAQSASALVRILQDRNDTTRRVLQEETGARREAEAHWKWAANSLQVMEQALEAERLGFANGKQKAAEQRAAERRKTEEWQTRCRAKQRELDTLRNHRLVRLLRKLRLI